MCYYYSFFRIYREEGKVKLAPCLTFCPWPAFKQSGFFYNQTDFLKNTFQKGNVNYLTLFSNFKYN